ncbi:peroxidasin homolog isoform X5 [Dicentrarchus labrax]|uniref:peroxidasin homolog isoform X5 n=1 Tax=Dicentrarchus labrax TaxID=13489 RepID=UPI0021F68607|nr:peroxidasin homolog isoform X5 [Dicentrarchus labrax]
MRVNIYICLSAFVLGCNVAAGIHPKIIREKNSVTLRCPHSVEGKVRWSRERDGHRVDILTADGGRDIKHIRDPGRRYSSSADKSLYIQRVTVSDTGRYFCNNEPAVQLTVIPSETIKKKNSVTLSCPHSVEGNVTWSRERNGTKVNIFTTDGDREIKHIDDPERRYNSSADKSLYIQRAAVSDTGRYFCNNEPVVELKVIPPVIVQKIIRERNPITMRCPHSVEGNVTWSRERNGTKVDILTADGDRDIKHIDDPDRRYSSETDKSLYIGRVTVSDTGRYLCNNEPAVQLTVIPSGTTRLDAAERTTITLKCPPDVGGSDVPTWSRDAVEIQQQRRFHVSTVNNTLIITDLQPADSGLYYCDGKPAAYLTVNKDETSERGSKTPPTSSTTTLTPGLNTAAPENLQPPFGLVLGIAVPFFVLLLLLTIIYCTWRCRFKRKVFFTGTEKSDHVYDEIQDGSMFHSANAVEILPEPKTSNCMIDYPDGSNHNDPTYSTISDLPPVGKKTETFLPNESPYSLIGGTFLDGNNKGSSKTTDNTYFLLEKRKAPGNQ